MKRNAKDWLFIHIFYPLREVIFIIACALVGAACGSVIWGVIHLCGEPAAWGKCAGIGAGFFIFMAVNAVASARDVRKREGW